MSYHIPILLAIAPLLAVGGLVAAAAAIAGLFKVLGRKKPTVEPPGVIAAAPFLDMRAGVTTAHLERRGTLWQWSLAGSSTVAGSDGDAGRAAVAMAEALVTAEEGAPISGSAGGPNVANHEFGVQPNNVDDGWDWTITTPSKLPAIGTRPAAPTMVASGAEATVGGATIRMLAKLSTVIPWLNVVDPGGKVGTGVTPPVTLPGLVIANNAIAVTDLATWVAYAAPKLREWIDDGSTADEIMDAVISDLPESATLSGKTIQDVRARVTELLGMLHDDNYVAVTAPDEQLAAFLVGAQLRDPTWRAMDYKGYVILVRPAAGGAPGTHWKWDVWEGGVRGYDDEARASGNMPIGKTRSQAERYAKQQIDQAVNANGVFPGEAGGESGGDQTGTLNPTWANDAVLENIPGMLESEAYMPPQRRVQLAAALWNKESQYDLVLLDFTKKEFYSFKHWRVAVGFCIRPTDVQSPFGVLSTILTGDVRELEKVRLFNIPTQIGPPPPVQDWSGFLKPLLWKGQYDGMVHPGPTIVLDPLNDVTGTSTGEQVDPCIDDDANWPVPENAIGFHVQAAGSVEPTTWQPMPSVSLVVKGAKVLARIRYRGFPIFARGQGGAVVALGGSTTKFNMDVKIWAAGTNEET